MAQKGSSKSNTRTSSRQAPARSGKGNGSSSRANASRARQIPEEEQESIFAVIWSSHWGKILYALVALLLLIAIDFLVSMNHYDRFFTILGGEIVVAMVLGWIVFLVLERRKNALSEQDPDKSEMQ